MNQPQAVPPFSLSYSPGFAEILSELNTSLVVSTFQAGKLILISAKDNDRLIQLPRNFDKPMGFSFSTDHSGLALACKDEVIVFKANAELARHYPKKRNTYDTLYMPRATYHTGALDIHDLSFGANEKLYAVNTLFSCIVEFDLEFNFKPIWQPPQIDELVSEDRCHLNGMAMENGIPKYASAFNQGNSHQSWRENKLTAGVIYDVDGSEVVASGLSMPHSPKVYDGDLFVLQSAKGELCRVEVSTGKTETIGKLDGFLRGMTKIGDYLFIARSKARHEKTNFPDLSQESLQKCGILAWHIPSSKIIAELNYESSVDEIYDIHALPGFNRPNVLNTQTEDHKNGLSIPEATYWSALS